MAPTEILAEQHYVNIRRLLEPLAVPGRRCSTGAHRGEERRELAGGARGRVDRTWSSARTRCSRRRGVPASWAWSIIDEQHRFGVLQRAALPREGPASRRAGDDRDADPAHAGADRLRRSRRLGDRRDAAGPARRSGPSSQPESRPRRGLRSSCASELDAGPAGLRRLSAGRGVARSRPQGGDRDGATTSRRRSSPSYRVGLLHGRMKPDEKDRVMGAFVARRAPSPGLDDGDRSRRRRRQRHRHGDRARRALRAVAAAPAARPRRPRRRTSPTASCCIRRPLSEQARDAAQGLGPRRPTASRSPSAICSCAARATSSARGSRGCRRCGWAICCATTICSKPRAAKRSRRSTIPSRPPRSRQWSARAGSNDSGW